MYVALHEYFALKVMVTSSKANADEQVATVVRVASFWHRLRLQPVEQCALKCLAHTAAFQLVVQ